MSRTVVNIPEKSWTKIATAVTGGVIRQPISSGAVSFFYTIRDTGDPAPTIKEDDNKALPLFENGRSDGISNNPAIDVYVWAENSDDDSDDNADIIVDL